MIGNATEILENEIQEEPQFIEEQPSPTVFYSVELDEFQGPMDLLLYLIEKDELDIYNISIARITKQYLAYIEVMKMLDIDTAGEFMVMAARLMQMKARLLLPVAEEEEDEVDLRAELIQALIEYKRIKKAAEIMSDIESVSRLRYNTNFNHNGTGDTQHVELEVNLFDLLRAFKEVSSRKPSEESAYEIEKIRVTVEDRMEYLKSVITGEGISFKELFDPRDTKIIMVVTFIALLELTRLHYISIRQNATYGEIWIYQR